jgi:fluoride exporter
MRILEVSLLQKVFWLALAGALGTLARYGLGGFVQRNANLSFPWGTMAVNMSGCFLFGLVWALAERRVAISGETRAILLIGFMGAFTTFSTFMFETGEFLRDGEWTYAVANLLGQNVFGIVFLFIGLALGRVL